MSSSLVIRAGASALEQIRREGLSADQVRVIAGAAGGPKWLALAGLDRFLFGEWFSQRREPLFTVGSSIATWRFTAAAQADPVAAIDRFEHAYLHEQRYSDKPDVAEISRVCGDLLDALLPASHVDELLAHPYLRPHIIAVRCTGRAAHESPGQLKAGLAAIALSNLISRERLGLHMQRVVFHHPRDRAPFLPFTDRFVTHEVALNADNLHAALRASASVPMMMAGEHNPPGAPPGMYRDGGLIDYHMDIHYGLDEGLVLFPHYSQRVVPGWLDKFLPWRKPHARHLDRVVMIAPSDALLARLPHGKIPDRKDFALYDDQDSLFQAWQQAAGECRRMADELADLLTTERIGAVIEPFAENALKA